MTTLLETWFEIWFYIGVSASPIKETITLRENAVRKLKDESLKYWLIELFTYEKFLDKKNNTITIVRSKNRFNDVTFRD